MPSSDLNACDEDAPISEQRFDSERYLWETWYPMGSEYVEYWNDLEWSVAAVAAGEGDDDDGWGEDGCCEDQPDEEWPDGEGEDEHEENPG